MSLCRRALCFFRLDYSATQIIMSSNNNTITAATIGIVKPISTVGDSASLIDEFEQRRGKQHESDTHSALYITESDARRQLGIDFSLREIAFQLHGREIENEQKGIMYDVTKFRELCQLALTLKSARRDTAKKYIELIDSHLLFRAVDMAAAKQPSIAVVRVKSHCLAPFVAVMPIMAGAHDVTSFLLALSQRSWGDSVRFTPISLELIPVSDPVATIARISGDFTEVRFKNYLENTTRYYRCGDATLDEVRACITAATDRIDDLADEMYRLIISRMPGAELPESAERRIIAGAIKMLGRKHN